MEDRNRWLRILVPALLVGTAAVLMVGQLHEPSRIIFDEVYYVNDARDFLEFGVEDGFVVHPPLGKLLIAFSIWLFGDDPFGWRALGALAGVGSVLVTYLIGRRLFDRVAPAALAALLLALDGIFLVQARTAMLDMFLAFFVTLGAWAIVVHVQRTHRADERWLAEEPGPHQRLPRRDVSMLYLAGVAFGMAVAVKWSGLLGLGGAGLVMLGTEIARRRRVFGSPWRRLGRGTLLIGSSLVLVPAVVYLVSWTPWFVDFEYSYEAGRTCDSTAECATTPVPSRAAALWRFHERIMDFHTSLEADHSYRAPAYTWPVLARPVVYYYETCSEDRANRVVTTNDDGEEEVPLPCVVEQDEAAEMLAVGNPALWWTFLPAAVLLVGGTVHRDRRAAIPLTFALAQYLPWLFVGRLVFSFYAVPMVPFVALGLAAAIARIGDRRPVGRTLLGGLVGGALLAGLAWGYDLALGDATRAVYGLVAAAGTAAGAALTAWRLSPPDEPVTGGLARPGWSTLATWLTVAVAVVAVGLAVFFLPVWLGIPLGEDAIRLRWWFHGWI